MFSLPCRYALANTIITDWMRDRAVGSGGRWGGDLLPAVALDAGTFKYVLIRALSADGSNSTLLLRGDTRAAYHNHILQAAKAEAAAVDPGLRLEVVGGGRMEHQAEVGLVSIYGFSAAFGQAPHEVSAALLQRWWPLHEVTVAYEGY